MCIIAFYPAGSLVDREALVNGVDNNPDGAGWAICTPDGVRFNKSMRGEDIIDEFIEWRNEFIDMPAAFHARIGTAGSWNVDNCHPFVVGDDDTTVIMHNGIFPDAVQPVGRDPRSDTRIFAEVWLPLVGSLGVRSNRKYVERWMGTGNKVIALSMSNRWKARAYILNEGAGLWDDGIWYSNTSYLYRPRYAVRSLWPRDDEYSKYLGSYSSGEVDSWESWRQSRETVQCLECGRDMSTDALWCEECGSCTWCGRQLDECDCHTPMALTSTAAGDDDAST